MTPTFTPAALASAKPSWLSCSMQPHEAKGDKTSCCSGLTLGGCLQPLLLPMLDAAVPRSAMCTVLGAGMLRGHDALQIGPAHLVSPLAVDVGPCKQPILQALIVAAKTSAVRTLQCCTWLPCSAVPQCKALLAGWHSSEAQLHAAQADGV